jgi:hypothetical protein
MLTPRTLILVLAVALGPALASGSSLPITAGASSIAPLKRGQGLLPRISITNTSQQRFTATSDGCILGYTVTNSSSRVVLSNRKVTACQTVPVSINVPARQTKILELDRPIGEIPTQSLPAGRYILKINLNVNGMLGQQRILEIPVRRTEFVIR